MQLCQVGSPIEGLPLSGRIPELITGGDQVTERETSSSEKDERQENAISKLILALQICTIATELVLRVLQVVQTIC